MCKEAYVGHFLMLDVHELYPFHCTDTLYWSYTKLGTLAVFFLSDINFYPCLSYELYTWATSEQAVWYVIPAAYNLRASSVSHSCMLNFTFITPKSFSLQSFDLEKAVHVHSHKQICLVLLRPEEVQHSSILFKNKKFFQYVNGAFYPLLSIIQCFKRSFL